MEPFSKSALVYLGFTALMGALGKIVKDRIKHPKALVISVAASVTSAYVAFLIGTAFEVTDIYMHILVWAGAYMGREFGELVVEALRIVIMRRLNNGNNEQV